MGSRGCARSSPSSASSASSSGCRCRCPAADSAQTAETRAFAERARSGRCPVPVELYDERFTTRLAERSGGRASEDSRAAAHLLESWLALAGPRRRRHERAARPEEREAARLERERRACRAARRAVGRPEPAAGSPPRRSRRSQPRLPSQLPPPAPDLRRRAGRILAAAGPTGRQSRRRGRVRHRADRGLSSTDGEPLRRRGGERPPARGASLGLAARALATAPDPSQRGGADRHPGRRPPSTRCAGRIAVACSRSSLAAASDLVPRSAVPAVPRLGPRARDRAHPGALELQPGRRPAQQGRRHLLRLLLRAARDARRRAQRSAAPGRYHLQQDMSYGDVLDDPHDGRRPPAKVSELTHHRGQHAPPDQRAAAQPGDPRQLPRRHAPLAAAQPARYGAPRRHAVAGGLPVPLDLPAARSDQGLGARRRSAADVPQASSPGSTSATRAAST